jgi:murein DD-endopeptidase MepM/ murein hydrolase activator NlpD
MIAAGVASITTGPSPTETLAANDLRAAKPAPAGVAPAAAVAQADDVIPVRHMIAPGETFATILVHEGVSAIEARTWEQAAASAYDVDAIQPRHALVLTFSRDGHELRACDYEIDKYALLNMRVAHGQIQARLKAMPQLAAVRGVFGRVDASLATSASAAGIPARMVSQLADVFGWEVDLETDVRRGDEFRLVYAEVRDESGAAHPGDILAAEITSHGRTLRAVRFENANGESEYYDPDGHAIASGFLKYPLEFDYVSSEFGSRIHPVLKRPAQHMGVDFAAPLGTPVRAVASGVVTFAGYAHGYGNQVGIDHQAPYASSYSHLRRIAKGLRVGTEVRKGQVIGYVGRSGMATGPHLHFMLFRDGTYVNPLAVKLPATETLTGARRFQFAVLSHELLDRLAALAPHVALPSVSLMSPTDVLRSTLTALD